MVGAVGWRTGQVAVVDPLLKLLRSALADQAEVVDPGRLRRLLRRLRAGVNVPFDLARYRHAGVASIRADLDLGQLQRVEDQLHPPAGQPGVDLVGVAVHLDRPGPRDDPALGPAERLAQQALVGQLRRAGREEPLKRRLPGLRMHSPVIDLLDPRLEGLVELLKARRRVVLELAQHLLADRAKYPLYLAATLGPPRPAVDQADPQHRARPQQLPGHERRAVVDVYGFGQAAGGDPRPQRPRGVQHILPRRPPIGDQRPAVIVKKTEQKRAVTIDQRPVQGVAGPQLVAELGLKAPQGTPDLPALPRQPGRRQVTVDCARRRRTTLRLQDDPVDLRRGARRLLTPKCARQLQQPFRRLVRHPPRRRHQRGKPALPIRADPAIHRVARHPHPPPIGPEMLPGRQRAHQHPTLPRRYRRVDRFADHPPTKHPDLLRPVPQPITSWPSTHPSTARIAVTQAQAKAVRC